MPNYITEGTGMRILLAAGGVPDGAPLFMEPCGGRGIAKSLYNRSDMFYNCCIRQLVRFTSDP